jgi:hypothetical protein
VFDPGPVNVPRDTEIPVFGIRSRKKRTWFREAPFRSTWDAVLSLATFGLFLALVYGLFGLVARAIS